jgi:hypothetical protein
VWEYKVIAGRYSLDGSDVVVENATGRTTLQKALTYYGKEGYELIDSHLDAINREVVVTLKRPFGGAAVAPAPAHAFTPTPAPDPEPAPAPARRSRSRGGGRRSKEELDRLYRDD